MPEVMVDVVNRMTGKHQDAIERVITKLHTVPCSNPSKDIDPTDISKVMDIFWDEFKHFTIKRALLATKAGGLLPMWLLGNHSLGMKSIPCLTQKSLDSLPLELRQNLATLGLQRGVGVTPSTSRVASVHILAGIQQKCEQYCTPLLGSWNGLFTRRWRGLIQAGPMQCLEMMTSSKSYVLLFALTILMINYQLIHALLMTSYNKQF